MNVILWVADSLRADHLSVYGYKRNASPHLDTLAQDSVVFERAYAQATWTKPSAGTLFTGMYPVVHGARSFDHGLCPDVPRLPAILGRAGLKTGVFSGIGQLAAASGFDVGVDHFVQIWEKEPYASGRRSRRLVTATEVRDEAERWMAQQVAAQTPFLAVLWTIDTHVPFEIDRVLQRFPDLVAADDRFAIDTMQGIWAAAKREHLEAILSAYDAAIMDTDAEIGHLVAFLKDKGIYDDTLLVVLADHGEVFNEHSRGQHSSLRHLFRFASKLPGIRDIVQRYRFTNPHGWLGHLDIPPYDEVLRVPLLMKFPRGQWRGRREQGVVQLVDLPPTILDLYNDQQSADQMQGRSILPVLRGEQSDTTDYTFSDSQTRLNRVRYLSVQQGDWKLIRPIHPDADWRRRLRDVEAWQRLLMPAEILMNVSNESIDQKRNEPDRYEHLRQVLDCWLADNDRLAGADTFMVVEDEQTREHLVGLGYL